jgi:pyrroline-5-carboxylate reductase
VRIGVIGVGAMGEAIVSAVLAAKLATPDEIKVANHAEVRLRYMRETYRVEASDDHSVAAAQAEYLLLAVKPQDFPGAAEELKDCLGRETTVLSIMAGVKITEIASRLGTSRVVRAMPNTPAQIGQGMTGWTATPDVGDEAREGARRIFAAMGKEAYVPDEKYIDMVTGLSGSGPAYVFLFIEALTDAGVHIGLPRDIASTMALQTVIGSALYADKTGRHPADLRNQVTSPGGTTAEGLRALEQGNLRADVLEAVIAAFEKSKALGEQTK